MQIFFELNGTEYRGEAGWKDDDGFTAELISFTDMGKWKSIPKLPEILIVRIDEARTGLLIKPFVTSGGGLNLNADSPISTSTTIKANAIVEDLPWDFDFATSIDEARISTTAMQLWRGDKNLSITFNRNRTGKGQFKHTKISRKIALGQLVIKQNLTLPFSAHMGSLHIRTTTSTTLAYTSPRELLDCFVDVQVIEGYFDLLAAFPRRTAKISLTFAGHDSPYLMRIVCDQNEHTLDPDPLQTFFRFDVFGASGRSFDRYHANFSEYRLFQATLRHLSRERVRLPEGFLTACNIIETLGKNAPSSMADLLPVLDEIEEALHEVPRLQKLFSKRIRRGYRFTSSFKDRFFYMNDFLSKLGVDVLLKHQHVIKTRGKFRHEITRLSPKDISLMSAVTCVAWVYGMIWLCREIGIPHKAMRSAVQSERFHLLRQTGLSSWGSIEKTANKTR